METATATETEPETVESVKPLRCVLAKLMICNNTDINPEILTHMSNVYDHDRKALRRAIKQELEKATMN